MNRKQHRLAPVQTELLRMEPPFRLVQTELLRMEPPVRLVQTELLRMEPPLRLVQTELLRMEPPLRLVQTELLRMEPPFRCREVCQKPRHCGLEGQTFITAGLRPAGPQAHLSICKRTYHSLFRIRRSKTMRVRKTMLSLCRRHNMLVESTIFSLFSPVPSGTKCVFFSHFVPDGTRMGRAANIFLPTCCAYGTEGDAQPCISTRSGGHGRRDARPCVSSAHCGDAVRRPLWITPCKPQAQLGAGGMSLTQPRSGLNGYVVPVGRGLQAPGLRYACTGLSTLERLSVSSSRNQLRRIYSESTAPISSNVSSKNGASIPISSNVSNKNGASAPIRNNVSNKNGASSPISINETNKNGGFPPISINDTKHNHELFSIYK
jgi:hypothetical protein